MWKEVKNQSRTLSSSRNNSKMVDPDLLPRQVLDTAKQQNDSAEAATRPACTEDRFTSSGIIPGAIAATVFIAFILILYAVLWKCIVSPPQRKHRKSRVRGHQKTSV